MVIKDANLDITGSEERKHTQGFIYSQSHLWPQSKEEPLAGFNLQHHLDNTNSQTCEQCCCGMEGAHARRCMAKGEGVEPKEARGGRQQQTEHIAKTYYFARSEA